MGLSGSLENTSDVPNIAAVSQELTCHGLILLLPQVFQRFRPVPRGVVVLRLRPAGETHRRVLALVLVLRTELKYRNNIPAQKIHP